LKRAAIAVGLVLVLAGLFASGLGEKFANPESITTWLEWAGPFGPLLFIALIIALFPVFLIGPPIWASLELWPGPLAYLYSSIGCLAASGICYALARSLGAERTQHRIPARVRKYEERLLAHPFRTIVALRVLLWANPAVDLLVGVSRVRPRDYWIASVAGLLPVTAFHVFVVGSGLGMAFDLPKEIWIGAAVATALVVAVRVLRNRRAVAAPDPAATAGP